MTDPAAVRTRSPRGSWPTPLISVVLLVGSLGSAHNAPRGVLPVLLLAGIAVACLPLAWSRPRLALPLAGAAVATFFALDLPNGPLFVVLPGVAFIAARQVPWAQLWPLVCLPLLMLFVGLALRVQLHDVAGFVTVWQAIGVTALALGATLAGARLTERQELRAEQARRSATEEQLRMAQGLHDGVGHGLAVIAMHAQVALHVLDKTPIPGEAEARLRQSLDAIRASSQDSLTALRRELAVMNSGAAARAPAPGVGDLRPLLERVRSGGLVVELPSDLPSTSEVTDAVGQVVYAVVQESLTNVLRHAQAQRAIVTFRNSGGRLTVTIADDGVGRPNPSTSPSGLVSGRGGLGITGLRNRVEDLGGHLETPSVPRGFVVSVTIPVAP
jgi:signal transduction histidine kinase